MRGIRPRAPLRAVSQLPRNENATLAAYLHAGKSLVKAWNSAPKALRKAERLDRALLRLAVLAHHRLPVLVQYRRARVVICRVKFLSDIRTPVGAKPAGVQNL